VGGFGGAASSMEVSTELAAPEVDANPELLPDLFFILQCRVRRGRTPRDELRDSCWPKTGSLGADTRPFCC
jgi:hypothetical protein